MQDQEIVEFILLHIEDTAQEEIYPKAQQNDQQSMNILRKKFGNNKT